jgi:tetratricopeptide (TPR) repeat protein
MRIPIRVAFAVLVMLALISCSRDPNVVKQRYLENGNKYFEKGKYKEAAIMYRNALQKDLRFGPAHYKLALTSLKLGQIGPAVGSLRRAVELIGPDKPEHWDAAIKLAEIYLAASKDASFVGEIDGIVQQLLKRDPNSFDGHRLLGDLNYLKATFAYRTKQTDEGAALLAAATGEYRRANQIKPNQTGVVTQLAKALLAKGQFAEAETLYRSVIDREKHNELVYMDLYRLYVVQNRPNDGEQLLKQAFAANPKQYPFLTLLAAHYYTAHRRDDMLAVLNQIKAHAHEYDKAYLMVGDFYLRMGQIDEAIKQYREGIAADAKKKPTYQKLIIDALLKQGKRNEAAAVVDEILKDTPDDNDARGLKASFMLDKGEVAKALSELQAVVTSSPKNAVAHYDLGRAHLARREGEQARQEFLKAKELRPDYLRARLALAQLLVARKEFDAATKEVQEILAIDKNNAAALLIQSASLMGQKKYGESRQLLDQMAKSNPNVPEVYFQKGIADLAESKFKEAEESFRHAYQLNPASSRGLMGIVETLMAQQKPDQALHLLQGEADRSPNRLDLRLALATTAVRAGRYDAGIAEFQKALGLMDKGSKASGETWMRIGETYRRKGDLGNAVNALQEARKTLPENPAVLSTLALSLDTAGRRQEARQVYEQALKMEPGNGVVLNNLAFLLADTGSDLDQALTMAQRAKQLLPNLYEVSDTLGLIYLKKALPDNAIPIFRDLVQKQPSHSTYRFHLGMALSQKGDKPKAIKELQEALKSNPPKEEREKIQRLIQKLG